MQLKQLAALGACALFFAGLAGAQDQPPQRPPRPSPDEAVKTILDLSEAQLQQLKDLRESVAAQRQEHATEIRRLQQEGPSVDLTARAKESARRGYETSLKQNAYWLGRLQTVHMMGSDPREILTRSQRIDAVTPALLQEVFKKYFPLDRYTAVTLMPEVAGQ